MYRLQFLRTAGTSESVYEDDEAIAFRDVNPVAPVHIPKDRDCLTAISKARADQKLSWDT